MCVVSGRNSNPSQVANTPLNNSLSRLNSEGATFGMAMEVRQLLSWNDFHFFFCKSYGFITVNHPNYK